jgi:hypothetical protein
MTSTPKSWAGLDLSDIEFCEATSVVTVLLEDYSQLGGPMGTETTSVLGRYNFTNEASALAFAKLLVARALEGRQDADKVALSAAGLEQAFKQHGYASIDCYAYGVTIKKSVAIGSFSYEQASKERVEA